MGQYQGDHDDEKADIESLHIGAISSESELDLSSNHGPIIDHINGYRPKKKKRKKKNKPIDSMMSISSNDNNHKVMEICHQFL